MSPRKPLLSALLLWASFAAASGGVYDYRRHPEFSRHEVDDLVKRCGFSFDEGTGQLRREDGRPLSEAEATEPIPESEIPPALHGLLVSYGSRSAGGRLTQHDS